MFLPNLDEANPQRRAAPAGGDLFRQSDLLATLRKLVAAEAQALAAGRSRKEAIYAAYERLNDGAAQADLWRLFVLWQQGGVYIDIDASLVWGLDTLLGERDALFIRSGDHTKFDNYFIAAAPGHPDVQRAIEQVLHNIDNYAGVGVYACTGPAVLQALLNDRDDVQTEERKYVCIQGTFVNDYFQYLDHPGKKWTDIDPHDLLKAPGEQQQGERE